MSPALKQSANTAIILIAACVAIAAVIKLAQIIGSLKHG